jgi:hypothetical protein
MRRAVLLALLLAACADSPAEAPPVAPATPAPAAIERAQPIEIPPLLRSCALPPAPPPAPRTVEQVATWAGELSDAYADCAYRVKRLVDLIKERNSP